MARLRAAFAFVPDYDNADSGFVDTATMFMFTACYAAGLSVIFTWLVIMRAEACCWPCSRTVP